MPDSDVLVHRPEFVRNDEGDWVLLPVHFPQAEGLQCFVKVHADWVRAKCPEDVSKNWYPDHADIQAMQILRSAYWARRIGQLPVSVLSPSDGDNPFLLDQLEKALAGIADLHSVESPVPRKQERQDEQVQHLHLGRPVDRRSDREVDNTLLQELELRCLHACESPAPEVVRDLNASLRPILDGRGNPISRAAPRGVLARDDGHLELGLELRGERISRQKASGYDEEEAC